MQYLVSGALLVFHAAADAFSKPDKIKGVNVGISFTLIGGVCFIMTILWAATQSDKERREKSMALIGDVIAIFSAVFMYQAANHILEVIIIQRVSEKLQALFIVLHFVFWWLLSQITLACVINHFREKQSRVREERIRSAQVERAEHWGKTVASLSAEFIAFSANNAFGTLIFLYCRYSHHPFHHPFLTKFLAGVMMLLSTAFLYFVLWLGPKLRALVSDVDTSEEYEKIYRELARGIEMEAIPTTCSFLITSVLRFYVCDVLPDGEGKDPKGETSHNTNQALWLLFNGFSFLVIGTVIPYTFRRYRVSPVRGSAQYHVVHVMEKHEMLLDGFVLTCARVFAWCLFFSVEWFIIEMLFNIGTDSEMMHIVVSTTLTIFVFLPYLFLSGKEIFKKLGAGKASTIDCGLLHVTLTPKRSSREPSIARVMNLFGMMASIGGKGLSILIGFAWEQTFDEAAEGSAEIMVPHVGKAFKGVIPFAFAFFILLVVLPSWHTRIVPAMIAFEKEETRKEHNAKKEQVKFLEMTAEADSCQHTEKVLWKKLLSFVSPESKDVKVQEHKIQELRRRIEEQKKKNEGLAQELRPQYALTFARAN